MTEDIESIAKRLVLGRKRDGRSIYDPQARSELVRASQRSGLSLARIAQQCGINANVLSNWVRQHDRSKGSSVALQGNAVDMPAAPAFVAVEMQASPPQAAPPLALTVRARLPNGVTLDVQVPDVDGAGQLIDVLGRLRCSASTRP